MILDYFWRYSVEFLESVDSEVVREKGSEIAGSLIYILCPRVQKRSDFLLAYLVQSKGDRNEVWKESRH